MGYSARYHAASLAAVFLALAIGILVGAEFGGEVLSDTRKSLERSLVNNLEESREEIDQLNADLERSEELGERVYPTLVGNRLLGDRVGLIGLGSLDAGLVNDVEAALESTGADLVGIGVLRRPPQLDSVASAMPNSRFSDINENPDKLADLGAVIAGQLASGGGALQRLRGEFFARASGSFGDLDQVVIAYRPTDPEQMQPDQLEASELLERGLVRGLATSDVAVVGIETTDTDPGSIEYFASHNITSVDNVDQVAGRLALVLALNGAQGSFGVKETADSLLPDLIPMSAPLIIDSEAANTGGP